MDSYGIEVHAKGRGNVRVDYRSGDNSDGLWDNLSEAEEFAYDLLTTGRYTYVTVGDGEHEFRMWRPGVTSFGEFNHPDVRWSDWYVDVEINGRRWRYRPIADLDDYDAADELGEVAATLYPDVTRIWWGSSDTGQEFQASTREG